MHEVAVAARMVEMALRAANENGGGRVTAARLVLGGLTCIDAETLAFAFDIASRNTPAAGCRLEIVKVPARLRCRSCRFEHESGLTDACPACGALGGEIIAGRELRLDSVDIEEEELEDTRISR